MYKIAVGFSHIIPFQKTINQSSSRTSRAIAEEKEKRKKKGGVFTGRTFNEGQGPDKRAPLLRSSLKGSKTEDVLFCFDNRLRSMGGEMTRSQELQGCDLGGKKHL